MQKAASVRVLKRGGVTASSLRDAVRAGDDGTVQDVRASVAP
ncbi:hypothetical protein ACRBEV_06555 [Methylobacterium phyllosphaerae]